MSVLTAATLGWATSAVAQTAPTPTMPAPAITPDVEAALAYPTSSQRFFEEGIARLEEEIQRLDEEKPEPVLTVQPEITEQFED
ncbi:MAG: hypothetical protein AAGI69_16110 [Cyanobacteria bacterium P01_H01_bin.21]